MGSFSLTAVNAFGDPSAAQVASARLADRGYPVVAAARLGDIAIRNGLLAIIGAAHDHERMIAISTRMHDRVAALAVVGGPLALLLGQHEGLTMPTLVVSDRVGRRDRRRIVRRLPRGSMVVRAVDFDAALDAVVTFLDRTAKGRRQPIRSGTLRPIALRLAPAALVAPAAAVVLAGSAGAAAVCTGAATNGLLTITCDGDGADLTLSATSDDLILLDGQGIANLSEIQKISILTTGGDDKLTIDQVIDKFRSGPEGAAIAFDLDGGGGLDEVKLITGLPAVQLTGDKISLSDAEQKVIGEIKYAGFDTFSYLGDATASKIEIDDSIRFAKLDLAGGGGGDLLKLTSGDGLIAITEEAISLNFSKIEIDYKEFSELKLIGGELDSKIEIAGFNFAKLDLDGGGGLDEVKLITGLPAVQLTGDKISLSDAEQKVIGEIKYAGFDTFSYLGDATASKIEIDDSIRFAKLDLAGGGGGDLLKLTSGDGLIAITEEAISLNFSKIEIDYKEFSELKLIGGDLDSKIEIAGFNFAKLDLDGGGGLDEVKLITGLPAVQLTGDKISLSDAEQKVIGEIKYAGFDTFSYLGDATASKIEIDDSIRFAKLDLAGGGGGDLLKLTSGDGLIAITEEAISLNFSKIEIDYKEFSELKLIGGELDSKIEIAGFNFAKLDLDGGGGLDEVKLITGLPAVQLTGDKISLSDAEQKVIGEIKYAGFDTFSYLGDATASKIEIDDSIRFAKLDLAGGGGGDLLKLTSGDGLIAITEEAISLNFSKIEIDYKEFSELKLIGGELDSKIEIAGFNFAKLDLDGGGGLDEVKLITGLPAVQLTGDKISLSDAEQKVIGEIKYAGFDTFSYLGDATASKIEIDDSIRFAKLDLAGGGGGDLLKLTSGDGLIAITEEAISLNFSKIEIDYKEFSELKLIGGELDSKIEIAGFNFAKLDLDGGGGFDDVKLSTGESLVKITDSTNDSAIYPGALNPIAHKGFESLSVLAVTDVANTFDGSKVETLKLTLDGGSRDDVLLGGSKDDLLTGGLGSNKISGGDGNDTLAETVDGDFVASNNTLSGAGLDAFSSIEALKLTGGASDNSFNTEPFKGTVTLDGGAGNDRMISGQGADLLIGGAGADSLNGGQGNDRLLAGDGDDTLNGGPGNDFGDGGDGIDTGKNLERSESIER